MLGYNYQSYADDTQQIHTAVAYLGEGPLGHGEDLLWQTPIIQKNYLDSLP